jgi:hypothetical protein
MRDHTDKTRRQPMSAPPGRKNGKSPAIPRKELLRRLAWYRSRARTLERRELSPEEAPPTGPIVRSVSPIEDASSRRAEQ